MILDTCFLIDLMRGKSNAIKKLEELERKSEMLRITSISLYELYLGITLSSAPEREKKRLLYLLDKVPVISLGEGEAKLAGEIQGSLMKSGVALDPIDALIAGIALYHNEALLTRNVKHFERIKELRIETY